MAAIRARASWEINVCPEVPIRRTGDGARGAPPRVGPIAPDENLSLLAGSAAYAGHALVRVKVESLFAVSYTHLTLPTNREV